MGETKTKAAEKLLKQIRTAAMASMASGQKAAEADRREAISRRDGIEQLSGNRQKIGHSQYGAAENAYDRQMEALESSRRRLETALTRQMEDLRAEAAHREGDSALSSEQARLQQAYQAQIRADNNQRRDYEYGVEQARADQKLRREEETAARKEAQTDRSWLQSLGRQFLSNGVMPSNEMLEAMNLSRESARMYVSAILANAQARSGGSSGRSSGSSGKSSAGTTAKTAAAPTVQKTQGGWGTVSGYNSKIASQVFDLARGGNYTAALKLLDENKKLFSEKNAELIRKTAWNYYLRSGKTAAATAAATGGGPSRTYALTK